MFDFFQYNTAKSFLHKIDARVKIAFVFAFSFCAQFFSLSSCAISIAFFCALYFAAKIPFRFQFSDIFLALLYAPIFYFSSVLQTKSFLPRFSDLILILRFFCTLQCCALCFRVTSLLEIRQGIKIEVFSFFLIFLPRIFRIIEQTQKAWILHGGKNSLKKIFFVMRSSIFILIDDAKKTARAISARSE